MLQHHHHNLKCTTNKLKLYQIKKSSLKVGNVSDNHYRKVSYATYLYVTFFTIILCCGYKWIVILKKHKASGYYITLLY